MELDFFFSNIMLASLIYIGSYIMQIDRSIIESFGEKGRICITSRVYPSMSIDKNAHLYVFNNGSQSVVISELNAWSMKQAEFGQEESINKQ